MQRSLKSLALSAGHLSKLVGAGFETLADLKDVGIVELSKDTSLSHSEALEVMKVVKNVSESPSSASQGQSALELLHNEAEAGHVVTFSSQVDSILGGGVPVGKITEICGAPGVGKTQFSMQLAVDVCIPDVFGGLNGEALYIDTEGSFIVQRVVDLAQAAVRHLNTVAQANKDPDMEEAVQQFTLEYILSRIHYYRCHDYTELVALVNLLPKIISEHPKVKLIVVDSVASPFRYGFQDMPLRNRILSGLSQNLIQMAVTRHIAVVLTNQMTTRIAHGQAGNKAAQLIPALGESWGHVCTLRLVLYWEGGVRRAWLLKSPNMKEQTVSYQITMDGVRDTVTDTSHDLEPPTQLPPSQDQYDFEDECLDDLLLEVPVDELTAERPTKRTLEECDLKAQPFLPAGQQPGPKRPHPEL